LLKNKIAPCPNPQSPIRPPACQQLDMCIVKPKGIENGCRH
jgi:hypothetical protein